MKKCLPLALALCLVLAACQRQAANPEPPPQPVALAMALQYYDKLGSYLEVPAFTGGELPEGLAAVNQELDRYSQDLQGRLEALNTSNDPGWLRCLCFPVSGERYLSLALFEYNEQADNLLSGGPELRSWVYDREEDRLVTEEEALSMAGTTLDEIWAQILREHTFPPRPPEEIELMGFLLDREGVPTFYLKGRAAVEDGTFTYSYSWTQGELTEFPAYDPPFLALEPDELDPPLYHQWYGGFDSQPPGGFADPPFNEYTIPKLLAEDALDRQMSTQHPAPEVLARHTAGQYTLLLIRQDSGVHAGGFGNLALGVWDNDAQVFAGDMWTMAGDQGICSSWAEDGAYYLLCTNTGTGSGWEGSSGIGWFRFDENGLEQLTTLPDFAREALPGLPMDPQFFDDQSTFDWWDTHKTLPVPGGMELFTRSEDYDTVRPDTYQWEYVGFVPLSREAAEYAPAARYLREHLWAWELEQNEYSSFYGPYLSIAKVTAVDNGWRFEIVNRYWESNGFPERFTLTATGSGAGWTVAGIP